MTTTHRPDPLASSATPNGRRSPNTEPRSPRPRPRARRASDAVVASYLHDISAPHRRAAPTPPQRERGEVLCLH